MPEIDVTPTEPEVLRQLDTMLTTTIFASRPKQAEFLKFIVTATLKGDDVSEYAIREELFSEPSRKYLSTIVRRTAGLVRQRVEEYNRLHDDLVVISMPALPSERRIKFAQGEAYKPAFAYNLHRQITKDYLLGCELLRKAFDLGQYAKLARLFGNIIAQEPNHAGAMVCMAEVSCTVAIFSGGTELAEFLKAVDTLTAKALRLASRFWRAHAVRAMYYCLRNQPDLAEEHFNTALNLDRDSTESHLPYVLFLSTQKPLSAIFGLAIKLAEQNFTDPTSQTLYGLLLCYQSKMEEASEAFLKALMLDRNFRLAHLGLAHAYCQLQNVLEGKEHAKRARILLDDDVQFDHWIFHLKLPNVIDGHGISATASGRWDQS